MRDLTIKNIDNILKDKNFTFGRIPDATSFKGKSFCFSMANYQGQPIEKRTILFLFAKEEIFVDSIIEELEAAGINATMEFTGYKDKYMTYEASLIQNLGRPQGGVMW